MGAKDPWGRSGDDGVGNGCGTGISRFLFRSSSSCSISLINTSKLAIDKFGGDVLFVLIAGIVDPERVTAGGVFACAGEGGVESLVERLDVFDFNDPGPPRRC